MGARTRRISLDEGGEEGEADDLEEGLRDRRGGEMRATRSPWKDECRLAQCRRAAAASGVSLGGIEVGG